MGLREDALAWQAERGLKDADMARLVGVSKAGWSRFKSGKGDLSEEHADAVYALIYEKSTSDLLSVVRSELVNLLALFDNPSVPRSLVWRRCKDLFGAYSVAKDMSLTLEKKKKGDANI